MKSGHSSDVAPPPPLTQTYAQAGRDYGTSLLWTLLLLVRVLYVNQEMVLRLGAVTGAGHARLILECSRVTEAALGGGTPITSSQTAVGALPYMAPEARCPQRFH